MGALCPFFNKENLMINVKANIAAMSPYSPPWSDMDRKAYLRLDLNENTQDPPAHVMAAIRGYIDEKRIQMYPEYGKFLTTLSGYAGVGEDHLIISNGSDQAIEIILRAFLGAGDTMVMAQPGFPIFDQVAGVIGAKVRGVPYDRELSGFPYEEFVNAITPETNLIVIINPDNPTGIAVPMPQIQEILEDNPDIPVMVDEAYFEYTCVTAIDLLESHPNLIVTRTFSKAFAMAGLRLGYIIAHPDIISQFYKIRGPFDVNNCATTVAQAQINTSYVWEAYVYEVMNVSRHYLKKFFDENNVRYFPGAAHFMLVQPENRDRAVNYLKEHGILVRPMFAELIKDTFRMNVGTLKQTEYFAEVYKNFLEE